MARKFNSVLDNVAEITSKFPWWAGVCLALMSFLLLNWYVGNVSQVGNGADGISEYFSPGMLHSFAFYAQFAVPAVFLLGSLASLIFNYKRTRLYEKTARKNSPESLNKLSWRDFEYLVAEYFRRLHFSIEETKAGSDGGVNLIAGKGREKYLILCKQWKTSEVGADVVEALLGAVSAAEATGGIVVTSGEFTKDAIVFARANKIVLLGGNELHTSLNSHKIFESDPERKPGWRLKTILWTLGASLVIIVVSSLMYSYKTDTPLSSIWTTQIKRLIPGNHEQPGAKKTQVANIPNRPESKDLKFTGEQVKKATVEVLHQKEQEQFKRIETDKKEKEKKFYYELELVSGGSIFTDNVTITKDKITYRNTRGLVVSLNKKEVKTLKKIQAGK
jgi:restriction system protein